MALTDINAVRSYIGDNDKIAIREDIGDGDGSSQKWQLDLFPARTGTIEITISAKAITNFTGSPVLGYVDFSGSSLSGSTSPTAGAEILATYQYNALSDEEIQKSIDLASGASLFIAAANAARSLAGNYARFFSYSQGDKKVDKDKLSKKLLALADSLEKADEKAIKGAGSTVTIMSFDDSGTMFQGYDTAVATLVSGSA